MCACVVSLEVVLSFQSGALTLCFVRSKEKINFMWSSSFFSIRNLNLVEWMVPSRDSLVLGTASTCCIPLAWWFRTSFGAVLCRFIDICCFACIEYTRNA